ncbi:MAG: CapA family protein [Lentisphaerae bacterium]|nr:CapA family protein [Lentisphaerota bacterium]
MKPDFDILQFANNHCFDFGVKGVKDALAEFDKLNIPILGVGLTKNVARKPVILERDGLKIGFYGIGGGEECIEQDGEKAYSNTLKNDEFLEEVTALRKKVDVLIVSVHWDNECIDYPNPQIQQLARQLIDNGVDLILGHHPHIPHGIEEYNGGIIVYSLGNFQFKCTIRSELDYSFIFKAEIDKGGVVDYSIIPVMVGKDSRPEVVSGEKAQEVLNFIARVSEPLEAGITSELFEEAACEVFFKDNLNAWARRVETHGKKELQEFFEWFNDPAMVHRFWLLMQKKNWNLYKLVKQLDIELEMTLDQV